MPLYPIVGSQTGFTIAGIPSTEWNAFIISKTIPPIGNTRDNELDISGATGIFDAGTGISRLDHDITFGLYSSVSKADLNAKIRAFMAAIDPRNGYIQLAFDEDPDYYLWVKLTSTTSAAAITEQPGDTEVAATMDLQFKSADPHWYRFSQPTESVGPFTQATGVLPVVNPGLSPSPVVLTITAQTATTTPVTITLGGETITWTPDLAIGDVVVIDTDAWTVTKNGANAIGGWSGTMVQLPGGPSSVLVNNSHVTVSFTYTPRTIA